MKPCYLTSMRAAVGVWWSFVDRIVPRPPLSIPLAPDGYRLERWIKLQSEGEESNVGIFRDIRGARVVVKILQYRFRTLPYWQLLNEASILSGFMKHPEVARSPSVTMSSLRLFRKTKHQLVLIKEYANGQTIEEWLAAAQQPILERAILYLRNIRPDRCANMGKRGPWQYLFLLPFHYLKAVRKYPKEWKSLTRLAMTCLRYAPALLIGSVVVAVTHFDLFPHNILVDGETITLLDTDMMLLAPREAEIALISRNYLKYFGNDGIRMFLERWLETPEEKRTFLFLAAYFCLQILSINPVGDPYARQSLAYMRFFIPYRKRLLS